VAQCAQVTESLQRSEAGGLVGVGKLAIAGECPTKIGVFYRQATG
jgi:hypothetical protein